MPHRVDFWGTPSAFLSPAAWVYLLMGLASLVMLYGLYRRAQVWWTVGQPEPRWDKPLVRLGRVVRYALAQTRVLGQRYPGVMHAGLAWGFFVFFAGTALGTIDSHLMPFLHGSLYLAYKFVLDVFVVAFLVGAAMAAYRRFIQRPARLTLESRFGWSLVLIVVIVIGGLLLESLRLAAEQPSWALASPAGWSVAQLWLATGASAATLTTWHEGVWAFHLVTVAVLMVTLPSSTLLHVFTAPLAVFFADVDRPTGQLAALRTTTGGQPIYPSGLRDLTWKQLLESDACTECGRCQDACPANASGLPLSPKAVMTGIRDTLRRDRAVLAAGGQAGEPLAGGTIADLALWSCTTCGACVEECPVLIRHVDTIVDLRRSLVIEGRLDGGLQTALDNLGRYGNSFGKAPRARAKWTAGLEPKVKDARKEPVEWLWFLGDYASYSPSLTEITRTTAEVFRAAGMDFGILYDAEQNAGNDVRRVGEEGLFELLAEKNQTALASATYRSLVTGDPHSYNTLKHEYPPLAGTPSVFHTAEVLDLLLASGRLKLGKRLDYVVTYHDPCFLGRYNGVYDAPRRVLAATGCRLVEMPRHGGRSLCCGAGGGRIWMELSEPGERPSSERIREAAALEGVSVFVVACPKDVTMFQDAVKTTGNEGRLVVKDLVELVHEAL